MSNPWLKKNPFMSMWFSAFNTAANTMRGQAVAQTLRQVAAATTLATKALVDAWLGVPPNPKPRRRKRRRIPR
jgi:hypothetical protein